MKLDNPPFFKPLTGLFEPSAIQQLPDGRFLVVEDEKQHAFSVVTLDAEGCASSTSLSPGWFHGGEAIWNLDDLEGLTLDQAGFVYAVTSHSRDDDGDEKKSRDKLARFRVEGNRIIQPVVFSGLKRALLAAHPLLERAAGIQDVKTGGGLNIEAIEITPDQQRLLIGFRSPLEGHQALIASVENPAAIFESGEPPQVGATLQALDLGGHGIRGMTHLASLGGYLIISGPAQRQKHDFGLWLWSGQPAAPARRVSVAGLKGFENAEGICPALINGIQKIIIVSDDGDRENGRCERFVLLDPVQLQPAS